MPHLSSFYVGYMDVADTYSSTHSRPHVLLLTLYDRPCPPDPREYKVWCCCTVETVNFNKTADICSAVEH